MDVLLIVLRLLHIVAAVIWFGLGITSYFFINPAAIAASQNGVGFLKSFYSLPMASSIIAIASGTTTLAGILMYAFTNVTARFSQTGNIVLGIGALAGLAATIHGGAVLGRVGKALEGALNSGDDAAARNHLIEQQSAARISLILMIIALIGMASARYL
jgi:uncharacterized membrane protein